MCLGLRVEGLPTGNRGGSLLLWLDVSADSVIFLMPPLSHQCTQNTAGVLCACELPFWYDSHPAYSRFAANDEIKLVAIPRPFDSLFWRA